MRKTDLFGLKLRHYCFFREYLEIDKIEGGDFKYSNTFMKILAQKYQKKTFLVPNLDNIVFIEILLLDKFNGCDSKYDNSFFKFLPKNTQLRYFWLKI